MRDTAMSRLRRPSDMCSSNVSDPANRLRKTRKKKSSAVPLFRSGCMSAICARLSKGKGRFTRGRKPQVSVLLCARAASAQFPSLRKRLNAILALFNRPKAQPHQAVQPCPKPVFRQIILFHSLFLLRESFLFTVLLYRNFFADSCTK